MALATIGLGAVTVNTPVTDTLALALPTRVGAVAPKDPLAPTLAAKLPASPGAVMVSVALATALPVIEPTGWGAEMLARLILITAAQHEKRLAGVRVAVFDATVF